MRKAMGFTLIELMVTVVILGIITAIAFPVYKSEVESSRRSSAKSTLLDISASEEKYYATNSAYTDSLTALGYSNASTGTPQSLTVPSASEPYYTVTITLNGGGAGYTATAAPTGSQAGDSCGKFTLDDQGDRAVTGSGTHCW